MHLHHHGECIIFFKLTNLILLLVFYLSFGPIFFLFMWTFWDSQFFLPFIYRNDTKVNTSCSKICCECSQCIYMRISSFAFVYIGVYMSWRIWCNMLVSWYINCLCCELGFFGNANLLNGTSGRSWFTHHSVHYTNYKTLFFVGKTMPILLFGIRSDASM